MVLSPKLTVSDTAIVFVDIQQKLFEKLQAPDLLLKHLSLLYEATKLLQIPAILTEQYPQGLGKSVELLASIEPRFEKTAFSCFGDEQIKSAILGYQQNCWIVAGIESHVCILQTVKDLLAQKKQVVVPVDAISSRSALDHDMAVAELRTLGARITTSETLLFELLSDAKHPQFKAISRLIK